MSKKYSPNEIQEIMSHDPLDDVEKITGKSYKDPENNCLSMALSIRSNEAKRIMLESTRDTYLSASLDHCRKVYSRLGFDSMLKLKFQGHGNEETEEIMYAPGMLLHYDTYGGNHINSCRVHYNWCPHEGVRYWSMISSGGISRTKSMGRDVWVGDHSGCEALAHNIDRLRHGGDFIEPWVEAKWLWLLNYSQSGEIDKYRDSHENTMAQYKAISLDKLSNCKRPGIKNLGLEELIRNR